MSVIGWRQWAVDGAGRLRPAWTPWSPFPTDLLLWYPDGLTRALCLRGVRDDFGGQPSSASLAASLTPHPRMPGEACACGLYGWLSARELAAAATPRWTSRPIVVGAARLGGRLVVSERGYRAQLGYPVAVVDPDGVVSSAYSVARYRTWGALVAEWDQSADWDQPVK
ncbi:hypothetical protein [Protofrankia sp. BMG5.30]|uniref:hypothetical protein n=1 Tax=Protofrankia sp. BMG5.30 TaxID=1834514 RepID=UPI000975BC16|nr:hypothetical protein [Protofrankia sp. BMG5.30]ONH34441.1 hypothetical protein BL254_16295 [Protofrankia sp. BMG5.30]